ncbi:FAD-dependent monooxygenase [Mycobacterium sp. 141]|uniref:FAD-dependent monooxygenase n=1 Tax=Mycobacterium sp. 141 TaxID=1120797 RepID=UPI000372C0B5|nr:FAD-dependent monooxygenase [Mycobacterium sp. 141]
MKVLVVGAGVAGLGVGLNLGRSGHDVMIIERANHLRTNGSPIDVRGDAIATVRKMGLLDAVLNARISMSQQSVFVDADGQVTAQLPWTSRVVSDSDDDIEIAREDLANILADALPSNVALRMSDSVTSLSEVDEGVDVVFSSGGTGRFDFVVGADGLHSTVRRLTFGPESEYVHHLGCYIAIADLPSGKVSGVSTIYNYPDHMVGAMGYKDTGLAVFLFRSEPLDYDYHDIDQQRNILADAYAGHTEWRIPELLEAAEGDPELYFDSASQIHMPCWHRGGVVLIGDAAHAASGLSGRGTSLALTGADFLAEEVGRSGRDLAAAFKAYESRQRPYVQAGQAIPDGGGLALTLPDSWEAIHARNAQIRAAATDQS